MVERSITTDCKSVAFGLRRFESFPVHKTKAPRKRGFCFVGEGFERRAEASQACGAKEAVPRPLVSGGERESRGRILPFYCSKPRESGSFVLSKKDSNTAMKFRNFFKRSIIIKMTDKPFLGKRSVLIAVIAIMIVAVAVVSLLNAFKTFGSIRDLFGSGDRTEDVPAVSMEEDGDDAPISVVDDTDEANVVALIGPRETYLLARPEMDGVKTYDDLKGYIFKHGSRKRIGEATVMDNMAKSYQDTVVSTLFSSAPTSADIKDVSVRMDGDDMALLNIANDKDLKWEVSMVLEDGEWKIDSEFWE